MRPLTISLLSAIPIASSFSLQELLGYHSASPLGSNWDANGPFDKKFEQKALQLLDHFHIPSLTIALVDGNETYAKVVSHRTHYLPSLPVYSSAAI